MIFTDWITQKNLADPVWVLELYTGTGDEVYLTSSAFYDEGGYNHLAGLTVYPILSKVTLPSQEVKVTGGGAKVTTASAEALDIEGGFRKLTAKIAGTSQARLDLTGARCRFLFGPMSAQSFDSTHFQCVWQGYLKDYQWKKGVWTLTFEDVLSLANNRDLVVDESWFAVADDGSGSGYFAKDPYIRIKKRKRTPALGSLTDLVTNGSFASSTTGWTITDGTITRNAGTGHGGAAGYADILSSTDKVVLLYQDITLPASHRLGDTYSFCAYAERSDSSTPDGSKYQLRIQLKGMDADGKTYELASGTGRKVRGTASGWGLHSSSITIYDPRTTTIRLEICTGTGATYPVRVDDVSGYKVEHFCAIKREVYAALSLDTASEPNTLTVAHSVLGTRENSQAVDQKGKFVRVLCGYGPDLLLRLLTTTSDGTNGAWDWGDGFGCGIPVDAIDTASFEAIRDEPSYKLFTFSFIVDATIQDALKWMDEEILQPMGAWMYIGASGLLTLRMLPDDVPDTLGVPGNLAICIDNGSAVLPAGVYVYSLSSKSWYRAASPALPEHYDRYDGLVCGESNGYMILLWYGSHYISADAGKSWTKVTLTNQTTAGSDMTGAICHGASRNMIILQPISTVEKIFYTTTGTFTDANVISNPFGGTPKFTYSWADDNIVYATQGTKLWHSTDNGASWSLLHTFAQGVSRVRTSSTDPDIIYVITSLPGLYLSTDGGANWSADIKLTGATLLQDLWIDPNNENNLYLSGYKDGAACIYKSTLGTATTAGDWAAMTSTAGYKTGQITGEPIDSNVMYAWCSDGGASDGIILATTDGWETCAQVRLVVGTFARTIGHSKLMGLLGTAQVGSEGIVTDYKLLKDEQPSPQTRNDWLVNKVDFLSDYDWLDAVESSQDTDSKHRRKRVQIRQGAPEGDPNYIGRWSFDEAEHRLDHAQGDTTLPSQAAYGAKSYTIKSKGLRGLPSFQTGMACPLYTWQEEEWHASKSEEAGRHLAQRLIRFFSSPPRTIAVKGYAEHCLADIGEWAKITTSYCPNLATGEYGFTDLKCLIIGKGFDAKAFTATMTLLVLDPAWRYYPAPTTGPVYAGDPPSASNIVIGVQTADSFKAGNFEYIPTGTFNCVRVQHSYGGVTDALPSDPAWRCTEVRINFNNANDDKGLGVTRVARFASSRCAIVLAGIGATDTTPLEDIDVQVREMYRDPIGIPAGTGYSAAYAYSYGLASGSDEEIPPKPGY